MKLCIKCNFTIDEKTGICQKCGHLAYKVEMSDIDMTHIEPYLPGTENDFETGRVSPIKYEPIKSKMPLMAIISNIILALGIIGLLIFYLLR